MSAAYEQGQAFGGVIDVLEAIGAAYAIWGGLAVVVYGEPRFTRDMDILLSPKQFSASLFVRRLQETHYHVDEMAVNRALGGGFFNVIHLGYHIKTDFYVPTEPELLTMLADRVMLPFDEMRRAAYITPTSLIVAKLRAYENSESTRHLDDIASIVRLQGRKLDQARIDIVAAQLGALGVWRSLWEGESAAVTAVLDLMHRIDSLAYGYNIQSYDANIVAADKEGQGRYGWFLHQSMGEK